MKFKVGDRVRVYCVNLGSSATSFVGTVEGFNPTGAMFVKGDAYPDLKNSEVHPKQCRKLKTKPLRRLYVPRSEYEAAGRRVELLSWKQLYSDADVPGIDWDMWIEFVETKSSKKGGGK